MKKYYTNVCETVLDFFMRILYLWETHSISRYDSTVNGISTYTISIKLAKLNTNFNTLLRSKVNVSINHKGNNFSLYMYII